MTNKKYTSLVYWSLSIVLVRSPQNYYANKYLMIKQIKN